ncbi:MAG: prolyl-tRNA synthetase associated domain-containing protein [Candidatus Peregrinibacteria bacterium]|nr:prolyl-tRNA synthetase associated domain-containing protein [Candidatus Peregrinibacteria bacterium]
MPDIESFLRAHQIDFQRFDHVAVFTCEEAERVLPPMPGSADTKNLFLRDKPGKRHILVSVGHKKQVDLKALSDVLGTKGLSFASPDRLMEYLKLTPGSVTLLGLMNDPEHRVEVVIDEELWRSEALRCHPLVNTATLVIPRDGIERFLQATGHSVRICDVPGRVEAVS